MVSRSNASGSSHRGLPPLLAALTAVGPLSVDTYLPSMAEIGRVLKASPLAVQQTLTAYMTTFALMTLWHGALSDTFGRRRVILWGTALFVASSLGCVFVHSIETLILLRAIQGITAGAGMVVGRAVVRDLFDGPEAQRLMSQVTLVFALAPTIAPILGGWLQVAFGWRSVFVFLVLFGSVAWFLCRTLLPETLPAERRQPLHPGYLARSYARVLTSLPFLAACCAMTLNFSGIFIYIVSAPVFVMTHLRLRETGFFWLFIPITMGMALGAWLSNRLAGRVSVQRTFAFAYAIMFSATAANLILSATCKPSVPWSVLPMLVYACGMSLAFPSLTLLALDLFPQQRGLAASCQSFVQTAGAAIISVVVTVIWGSVVSLATWQLVFLGAGFGSMLSYFYLRNDAIRPPPINAPVLETE